MLHLQGIFTVRKSVSYAVRDLQAWINCCVIEHGETETRVDNSGVSLCSFTKLPLAKLDQMHSQQFTSVPQLTWVFRRVKRVTNVKAVFLYGCCLPVHRS